MPCKSTPASALRGARLAPPHLAVFRRQLAAWYDRVARDLPWRRTRDPYRVLVSEVMLQQTQVQRVEQFYPRFLERFPDLATLARAHSAAVREAWEGLGYYARARNLHALAKTLVQAGDVLPDDPRALEDLPGIGPYTAGAVASFAYERPVPAVDTNVARVIRRIFWGRKDASARDVWRLAALIVPRDGKRAWKFNQAVMELGALVCVARRPRCPECPVRSSCRTGRGRSSSPEHSGRGAGRGASGRASLRKAR